MILDSQAVKHYQKLTDSLVDLWYRSYRFDELRLYLDGYICCLRHTNSLEPYLVHRLEEVALRFLQDPSNFDSPVVPERETDYY